MRMGSIVVSSPACGEGLAVCSCYRETSIVFAPLGSCRFSVSALPSCSHHLQAHRNASKTHAKPQARQTPPPKTPGPNHPSTNFFNLSTAFLTFPIPALISPVNPTNSGMPARPATKSTLAICATRSFHRFPANNTAPSISLPTTSVANRSLSSVSVSRDVTSPDATASSIGSSPGWLRCSAQLYSRGPRSAWLGKRARYSGARSARRALSFMACSTLLRMWCCSLVRPAGVRWSGNMLERRAGSKIGFCAVCGAAAEEEEEGVGAAFKAGAAALGGCAGGAAGTGGGRGGDAAFEAGAAALEVGAGGTAGAGKEGGRDAAGGAEEGGGACCGVSGPQAVVVGAAGAGGGAGVAFGGEEGGKKTGGAGCGISAAKKAGAGGGGGCCCCTGATHERAASTEQSGWRMAALKASRRASQATGSKGSTTGGHAPVGAGRGLAGEISRTCTSRANRTVFFCWRRWAVSAAQRSAQASRRARTTSMLAVEAAESGIGFSQAKGGRVAEEGKVTPGQARGERGGAVGERGAENERRGEDGWAVVSPETREKTTASSASERRASTA